MNLYFYDIETIRNLFSVIFVSRDKKQKYEFVLFKERNDLKSLLQFISKKPKLVGFNNIDFDAQIIQYIWVNQKILLNDSTEEVINKLYQFAQDIINRPKDQYLPFKKQDFVCFNLDLYRMLHLNGAAKRCSLKWCEFSMDWHNLLDMPIKHYDTVLPEQVDSILEYNLNDVLATIELFEKHISEIQLRSNLSKEFGLELMSSSEPSIAKEVFAKFLTSEMKIKNSELKKLRTHRQQIFVKDIIQPNVYFKTEKFNKLLDYFKKQILKPEELNNSDLPVKYRISHQNCLIDYGLGGVHGFVNKPTIFEENEEYEILSLDAVSFYPFFNFITKKCPEHIPKNIFNPLYKSFFEKRKLISKKDPMNYVYKIILNSND
jgi:hypothetical protein